MATLLGSYDRSRAWLNVEVHPLFPARQDGPSSSQQLSEVALASPALWASLTRRRKPGSSPEETHDHHDISVAVRWPLERRLGKGKQKERSLVIHLEEDKRFSSSPRSTMRLYVPVHLFPAFSTPPLTSAVTRHEPIPLSLAVLQPVLNRQEASLQRHDDQETYDIDPLFGAGKFRPPSLANGLQNGHHDFQPRARILRQGDTVTLHSDQQDRSSRLFRILLLEPVDQGILSPRTKVVISTRPHIATETEPDWPDGDAVSESSRGRTRLSLANFDPDAFLTTDLSFHSADADDLPEGLMLGDSLNLAQSAYSSTSGSITPKPGGRPVESPSPPVLVNDLLPGPIDSRARFTAIRALGPSRSASRAEADSVCWVGVASLGRAGIFDGDWVLLRSLAGTSERLVKAVAWERLDETADDMRVVPINAILLPPLLYRALLPENVPTTDIVVSPTSFGARLPTLPVAKTMTLARIATAEGIDKRYERSWLRSLKEYVSPHEASEASATAVSMRLVRRGDILAVPVEQSRPLRDGNGDPPTDSDSDEDSCGRSRVEDGENGGMPSIRGKRNLHPAVAYFIVTSLSYEPITSLEDDFSSSTSSKARAGELGCWVDTWEEGSTKMVLTGVERAHIAAREADNSWLGHEHPPPPYSFRASSRLRHMLRTALIAAHQVSHLPLSVLVKGARGAGKISMIRAVAAEVGYSLIDVDGYELAGETTATMQGILQARADKAKACAPSMLVLTHVEALGRKSDISASGRPPAAQQILEDTLEYLRQGVRDTALPCLLIGLTSDAEAVPPELLSCFKQHVSLDAPDETERLAIIETILSSLFIASDVDTKRLASQTAAFHPGDLKAFLHRSHDLALARALQDSQRPFMDLDAAGVSLTKADVDAALSDARTAYSARIDAPQIPNVSWDDVGGLAAVKADILDTIQLPLEHPELFADGLKKRSGILLYGPPGTGKTLLAKAVATSCSLNFFSVKGPELLNMYIGESEANVRRVFQRARDASPCVIFMDELDSVAPKRGNQGDSGGVMDRIVSQLLAELDGMSAGDNSSVFVMGATNRPDLLDPALLRPGRFDRMLYLGVAQTHEAQLGILQALTRKFRLSPALELVDVAEMCPFTYTGADFYALCSDAMLRAMARQTDIIDRKVAALNSDGLQHEWPTPLTVQYYLERLASEEEVQVEVNMTDFVEALRSLVPSVSQGEMEHYERVQREFKGFEIGRKEPNGHS